MSVRLSLLAILDQGPCYGYQLRTEFERRTGATWPLNVGQIYNTLDRLERDGLVTKGTTDERGHVYYAITDAGSAAVGAWLASPVERGGGTRDEVAIKIAIAATLPGVDAASVIRAQRAATRARLDSLEAGPAASDSPEDVARTLVADSVAFQADAELRWLDHVEQVLAGHPEHAIRLDLATDRPRRGRPVGAVPRG